MRAVSLVLLVAAIFMLSGCSKKVVQIGGVSGTVLVGDRPLPERSTLTFYLSDSEANFTTSVNSDGFYRYVPYSQVPVAWGIYKVVITPPAANVIKQDGVAIPDPKWKEVKLPIAPQYLKKDSTPLEVELTAAPVIFDINL